MILSGIHPGNTSAWVTFTSIDDAVKAKRALTEMESAPGVPLEVQFYHPGASKSTDELAALLAQKREEPDFEFGLGKLDLDKVRTRAGLYRLLGQVKKTEFKVTHRWDWLGRGDENEVLQSAMSAIGDSAHTATSNKEGEKGGALP